MHVRMAEKGEYKTIQALYQSAFPRDERAPFFVLRSRARQGRAQMLVAEERGAFIGFAYTVCHQQLVYLLYFAVAEDRRGKGSGSQILCLLKERYKGKFIFLAREPLDDAAENRQERIRRHRFYRRNGFMDMPFQIREASVVYDVMSTSDAVTPEGYNALIKAWAGALARFLVPMEAAHMKR